MTEHILEVELRRRGCCFGWYCVVWSVRSRSSHEQAWLVPAAKEPRLAWSLVQRAVHAPSPHSTCTGSVGPYDLPRLSSWTTRCAACPGRGSGARSGEARHRSRERYGVSADRPTRRDSGGSRRGAAARITQCEESILRHHSPHGTWHKQSLASASKIKRPTSVHSSAAHKRVRSPPTRRTGQS